MRTWIRLDSAEVVSTSLGVTSDSNGCSNTSSNVRPRRANFGGTSSIVTGDPLFARALIGRSLRSSALPRLRCSPANLELLRPVPNPKVRDDGPVLHVLPEAGL